MSKFFLSALTRAESARQRARCLHSPGGVHAFPARSARGRRMLFIRFVNRAVQAVWRSHHQGRKQTRDSGHSPFGGPARGRSPRAVLVIGSFSTDRRQHRQSIIRHWRNRSLRRFQLQPLRHLGTEADFEFTSVNMRCRMPAGLRATATTCSTAWHPNGPRHAMQTTS